MLTLDPHPSALELPDSYTLGETRAEVKLDSADAVRDVSIAMAAQANYHINIFTQNLDAELYDNADFESHVASLARRHPNTQIRILVQDSDSAVRNGHRLIRLAHLLTSSVMIHNPHRMHQDDKAAFMVVDGLGMVHRISGEARQYDAKVNFMSPLQARQLNEQFDEMWEHSSPDQQLRRLYM